MKRQGISNRNSAGAVGTLIALLLRTSGGKRKPVPATGVQQSPRHQRSESKASTSSGGGQKRWKVAAFILALLLAYLVLRAVVFTVIDFCTDIAQIVNWEPPERGA